MKKKGRSLGTCLMEEKMKENEKERVLEISYIYANCWTSCPVHLRKENFSSFLLIFLECLDMVRKLKKKNY